MTVVIVLIAITLVSAAVCRVIALRRGLNPVLWVVLGVTFGPLAVALALLVPGRSPGDDGLE